MQCTKHCNVVQEVDNLAENRFVTKRCELVTLSSPLWNTDVSNMQLLLTASSAGQKYLSYLEKEKKKECSDRGQKCKALNDDNDK